MSQSTRAILKVLIRCLKMSAGLFEALLKDEQESEKRLTNIR